MSDSIGKKDIYSNGVLPSEQTITPGSLIMSSCAAPLTFLSVGLDNSPVAEALHQQAENAKEKPLWAVSPGLKILPIFKHMRMLQEAQIKFAETRSPRLRSSHEWHVPIDRDKDLILELHLTDGKIAWPFKEHTAFSFCKLARWYEPTCVPGILTFVLTNAGDELAFLYGNEQYVQLRPTVEEIGPDHKLRELIETHVATRGLDHINDSWAGTRKWELLNGQANRRSTPANHRAYGGFSSDAEVDSPAGRDDAQDALAFAFATLRRPKGNTTFTAKWQKGD